MAPGPLPKANRRRRNAPTIPTKKLPAGGRTGRAPAVPRPWVLGEAGMVWWRRAWRQAQAVHWEQSALHTVLRRAMLEDTLAAIASPEPIDLAGALRDSLGLDEDSMGSVTDVCDRVEALARGLRAAAGDPLSVMREMRALDKVLGIDPKAMADLRWELVADPASVPDTTEKKPAGKSRPRGLLQAVDSA